VKQFIAILSIVCLCGCKERFSSKPVMVVPGDKVTTTVTETCKVERPVPVYRIVSDVKTNTKTFTNTGEKATPLHDATIKTQVLDTK
jgi:hypothetical protein